MAIRAARRPPALGLLEIEPNEQSTSGSRRWSYQRSFENSQTNDDQEAGSTILLVQIPGPEGHEFEQGELL